MFARQLCNVVRPFVVANHSAHFGATRKLLLTEQHTAPKPSRRYVLAGSLAAAGTVAAPQVSRAQTQTLRFQSAWRSKDILNEFALGYAKSVSDMTGGRIRIDMSPAGGLVPAIQMQEAVHAGVLDGSHGSCSHWYNKHRAFALFGSPPPFGWDSQGMLAWFYQGGGEALYAELTREVMKLNIVGMLAFPMPTQPLGFFKKEIKGLVDEGVQYIQIDAPRYSYYIDPKWREFVKKDMGVDPDQAAPAQDALVEVRRLRRGQARRVEIARASRRAVLQDVARLEPRPTEQPHREERVGDARMPNCHDEGPGPQRVEAVGADAAEASRYLLDVYEKTVTTYAPSFKTTFRRILDSDDAVLYHCSAGKDRTGIFTALLLTFLGVPRATVVEDYLRSNAVVTDEQVEAMAKRTKGQPAAARIILSVDASYLQLAFATIDRQYGSLDAYRRSQLGLSDPDVARLKARLLE